MKKFARVVKDDTGLILGIVLIALTIVGTVLGSVMMMSQISLESKGQSIEQLKSKNQDAQSSASNLQNLVIVEEVATDLANSAGAPNCGVPTEFSGSRITCTIDKGSNSNTSRVRIEFADKKGNTHIKTFVIPNKSEQDSESD